MLANSETDKETSRQGDKLTNRQADRHLHNVFYGDKLKTNLNSQAVRKTVSQLFLTRPVPSPTTVHFKVDFTLNLRSFKN